MPFNINPEVIRTFWPGFIPLLVSICSFPLVAIFCRYKRQQLLKLISWLLLVFVIWTAYLMWIIITLSNSAT